jgi:hypothetical protein
MIHGIYVKSKPKSKWHLFSMTISAEAANVEMECAKQEAIDKGNDQAVVGIQIFESAFWIPEYLDEIKEEKPQFN